MNYSVMLDKSRAELSMLRDTAIDAAASASDEEWSWKLFSACAECEEYIVGGEPTDLDLIDVTLDGAVELSERLREQSPGAVIVVIADASTSPAMYIRPTIAPGALLLRPFTSRAARDVLVSSVNHIERMKPVEDTDDAFVVVQRESRRVVPYSKILYFEAREKKVFLNTGAAEYSFADTLDALEQRLPDSFVRCHRSFIVSRRRISRIFISRSEIELDNGMFVPLSRSYKAAFKEG